MDDTTRGDADGEAVADPRPNAHKRRFGRKGLRVVLLRGTATTGDPAGFSVVGRPPEVEAAMRRVLAGASETVVDSSPLEDPEDVLEHHEQADAQGRSLVVAPLDRDDGQPTAEPAESVELLGRLTPQETRVLHLVAEGLTNRAIADELDLAEKTVRNYVSNLLGKLRMQNRTQAAAFVARQRLTSR